MLLRVPDVMQVHYVMQEPYEQPVLREAQPVPYVQRELLEQPVPYAKQEQPEHYVRPVLREELRPV